MILSPKEHYVAANTLDEDVNEEMRNYKKSIIAFYNSIANGSTIFIETALNVNDDVPHMHIDCIGVPEGYDEEAKLFFTKALKESPDEEWSVHKKIMETYDRKGDLTKMIPGNFSYFHVDFNGAGGYAHIIENDKKFPAHFGLEILAGAIEETSFNPHAVTGLANAVRIKNDLMKKFEYFDWTRYLK